MFIFSATCFIGFFVSLLLLMSEKTLRVNAQIRELTQDVHDFITYPAVRLPILVSDPSTPRRVCFMQAQLHELKNECQRFILQHVFIQIGIFVIGLSVFLVLKHAIKTELFMEANEVHKFTIGHYLVTQTFILSFVIRDLSRIVKSNKKLEVFKNTL